MRALIILLIPIITMGLIIVPINFIERDSNLILDKSFRVGVVMFWIIITTFVEMFYITNKKYEN